MLVLDRADPLPPGLVACIGAFDGLHRGHRALFDHARQHGEGVALVTFWPHPAAVLAPDRAPPLLQSPRQRERVARDLGLEALVVLTFDAEVAAMSPRAFTDHFFVQGLRPAGVVVGEDFRYGASRAGDTHTLRDDLAAAGIPVFVVSEVQGREGEKLGSTAIRRALQAGEVDRAARILGRPYAVEGKVVHGEGRGRTLGFPTANVVSEGAMLPSRGVYAVTVHLTDPAEPEQGARWPGVANIGVNPTFGEGREPGLEVHVIDRALGERLYGRRLEVEFVARLRDEQRFDGPDALVAAIEGDVARARRVFVEPETRRHAFAPPLGDEPA